MALTNPHAQAPANDSPDSATRPKVLRRPAQFSRKAAPVHVQAPEPLNTSALPVVTKTPERAPATTAQHSHNWQEDGRFGLALVLIVLVVNVALSFALPFIGAPKPTNATAQATRSLPEKASMPSAMNPAGSSGVQVYSEPNHDNAMTLRTLPSDYNEFDTSPDAMPAPKARQLEGDIL